jgi:hypothetical protein
MKKLNSLILFSCVVTFLFLFSACQRNIPAKNEALAIKHLNEITSAQMQYSINKGSGNFTDLATLGQEGLLDTTLSAGEKDGYIFHVVTFERTKNMPAMLDATATPKSKVSGGRSFYTNEIYIIWEQAGENPPSATTTDRIPKNGEPIQ